MKGRAFLSAATFRMEPGYIEHSAQAEADIMVIIVRAAAVFNSFLTFLHSSQPDLHEMIYEKKILSLHEMVYEKKKRENKAC